MSAPACDVLIAGAGPVGLTLALALGRLDLRLRIVDKAPGPSGESRAVTVQPRTLELFHLLGLADGMVAAGVPAGVMNMHVGARRATVLHYDRLSTAYPFYLHLHQGHTELELARALESRGRRVERSTALEDFSQDGEGVTARLLHGDGRREEVRARYLVGCDGGHSRVRQQLGLTFTGRRHDDNWIMTDVRIPDMPLPRTERHGYILERFPFVVLPLGGDFYRLISARMPDSPRLGQDPTLDEFRVTLARLGLDGWTLEEPRWLTNYNPSQFLASSYRVGRVFVAGDAAHVNTPIAAQGLNTGAVDALNLAWKLDLALRGLGGERLLDSYHAERHPAAQAMFEENDRLTRMVFGKSAVVRLLSRGALWLLNVPARNLAHVLQSSQLGLHYRSGPLAQAMAEGAAQGTFDGTSLPGDRVPHVPLGGSTHLYDFLRPDRHTLLLFAGEGPDTSPLRAAAERAQARYGEVLDAHTVSREEPPLRAGGGSPRILRDAGGRLHAALGVRRAGCVLIRPDAHVAAHLPMDPETGLVAWFSALRA